MNVEAISAFAGKPYEKTIWTCHRHVEDENACPINALKEEQAEAARKKRLAENYEQRVKDMDAFIKESAYRVPEFDNENVI